MKGIARFVKSNGKLSKKKWPIRCPHDVRLLAFKYKKEFVGSGNYHDSDDEYVAISSYSRGNVTLSIIDVKHVEELRNIQ